MSYPFERCACGHIRASHVGMGGTGVCSACHCTRFREDHPVKVPAGKA